MALSFAGVTYIIFYAISINLFNNIFLSSLGSLFGICGGVCCIGVAMTPSDLFFNDHIFYNTWLFRSFLISIILYSFLIYKSQKINNWYLLGNIIFILSLLIYILILKFGPSPRVSYDALVFQAISQKVILFNFMASIIIQTYGYNKIID
tara:strand:- start:105 stop:554 length:450 start_codon:yes stop_codon:yes gene_type:complete